ncbi:hypothetical protein JTE90_005467 [Oedothorax gibbosus]|uniref:Uncharacterized protein n=1 Tax=Oedothorax gibbosus TaxID=931172 RepID=A0AAV6UNQ8_9ARAC|nr:hypothetical protein JTE90_005467 [Oedothorax gibbosus]
MPRIGNMKIDGDACDCALFPDLQKFVPLTIRDAIFEEYLRNSFRRPTVPSLPSPDRGIIFDQVIKSRRSNRIECDRKSGVWKRRTLLKDR